MRYILSMIDEKKYLRNLKRTEELIDLCLQMKFAYLKEKNPDWSDSEIRRYMSVQRIWNKERQWVKGTD
jgi:hypothetical protein